MGSIYPFYPEEEVEAKGLDKILEDIELLEIEEDEQLEMLGDWLEGMIDHVTEGR